MISVSLAGGRNGRVSERALVKGMLVADALAAARRAVAAVEVAGGRGEMVGWIIVDVMEKRVAHWTGAKMGGSVCSEEEVMMGLLLKIKDNAAVIYG